MVQIGRYRIIGELGRGAMGMVQLATDPAIGRYVAIKTIRIRDIDDTARQEKLRERLFREARSAGVLSHPNIVTIYDMGETDGVAYIAMAYVNGPTLEKALASDVPPPGQRMFEILRQTASALDYAHGKGIVHRDIKPGNIMLDEEGHVKITDFGIARTLADGNSTQTRSVVGTPNYMSPEQVQAQPVDGRSDQFSLAVIAYEILTGERPFAAEHLSGIVFRIVNEEPVPAHRLNGTLTPAIDSVLRKGMAKKPGDRFPNCSSFVGALEMACAESRGWKTIAAGMSGIMPTVGVEKTTPRKPAAPTATAAFPSTPPPAAPSATQSVPVANPTVALPPPPAPPPEKAGGFSMFLAVAASVLLLALVAAIFLKEAGLVGDPPVPPETASTAASANKLRELPPEPAVETDPGPDKDDSANQPPPDKEAAKPAKPAPAEPAPVEPVPESTPKRKAAVTVVRILREVVHALRPEEIRISTFPQDAKIVLDGNSGSFCFAPCALHAMPGQHHITIAKPGYATIYKDVQLGQEPLDLGEIHLDTVRGTLLLSTDPQGARIRINGAEMAELTPAKLSLKPGVYSVTVEKDGASKTENVSIGDGTSYRRIPLTP